MKRHLLEKVFFFLNVNLSVNLLLDLKITKFSSLVFWKKTTTQHSEFALKTREISAIGYEKNLIQLNFS